MRISPNISAIRNSSKSRSKTLLSADYAKQRRTQIRMDRANPNIGPGDAKLVAGDTTYLTVADKDGMMVSLIQSNYADLGSGLVADGLGLHVPRPRRPVLAGRALAQRLCARRSGPSTPSFLPSS